MRAMKPDHPNKLVQQWQDRLNGRAQAGQLRRLRAPLAVDFVSNDYLGWARADDWSQFGDGDVHQLNQPNQFGQLNQFNQFHQLAHQCSDAHGATGSRLLSGNSQVISDLEAAIAQFHQTEAALIFNSGFDANLGVLSAIGDRHTVFLYDELCHASLIDGMRLSMARAVYKFRHNDPAHLAQLLAQHGGKPAVIVLEAVYSMDGDTAPLAEMVALAQAHQATIVLDEAHATGVIGARGEGLAQSLNCHEVIDVRIHTFGKALGCHGAVVVGSRLLIDLLTNFARPLVYSTALPPASIARIALAYARLSADSETRSKLHARIADFRTHVAQPLWAQRGAHWLDSTTPIQGLVIGDVARTHAVASRLQTQQLDVRPIFPPTVAVGTERLRICLHAFNTDDEVDDLMNTLVEALA